ncbi:MAG: hypothetical protein HZC36_06265 [Armatimonadetes bacterium]|nr:hypothetical protein [Armatimonadota bacterium]
MKCLCLLSCAAVVLMVGCAAPAKPSEAEVAQARQSNEYTRDIDKTHAVANDQSSREDDPALH